MAASWMDGEPRKQLYIDWVDLEGCGWICSLMQEAHTSAPSQSSSEPALPHCLWCHLREWHLGVCPEPLWGEAVRSAGCSTHTGLYTRRHARQLGLRQSRKWKYTYRFPHSLHGREHKEQVTPAEDSTHASKVRPRWSLYECLNPLNQTQYTIICNGYFSIERNTLTCKGEFLKNFDIFPASRIVLSF